MSRLQDMISGVVSIEAPTDVKHEGVYMTIEGAVDLQTSSQSVGAFDAFYNSVKVTAVLYIFLIKSLCYLSILLSASATDDVLVGNSSPWTVFRRCNRNTVWSACQTAFEQSFVRNLPWCFHQRTVLIESRDKEKFFE